jgi:hypothetical protein
MPNLNWDELNNMQVGRYAEYYAKMEFASYGFEIYASEVDDHGIDFVMKKGSNPFYEVQVKSLRESNNGNYIFMQKDKFDINNDQLLLCFIDFCIGKLPFVYIIPSTVWKNPNKVFVSRDYEGKKSNPEWGLNYSKIRRGSMGVYLIDNYIKNL